MRLRAIYRICDVAADAWRESPETLAASAVGPFFSWSKPLIAALNAALADCKMKAWIADLGGTVLVFEPSAYCRLQVG
jgi:hypothetical protein